MENKLKSGLDSIFLIKSLDVFKSLDIDIIYRLIKSSGIRESKENAAIAKKGDKNDTLFLLLKGEIGVFSGKDEKLERRIHAGEMVFMPGFFEGSKTTSAIKALNDAVILMIEKEDFVRLLSSNGAIAACFVKILGSNLRKVLETDSEHIKTSM